MVPEDWTMMGVMSLSGSSWKEKLSIRPEEGCSDMVLMYVRPSARVREVLSRVVPAEAKADGTSSAAVSTRAAARLDRSCSLGYFMLTLLIRLKMNMYRRPRLGRRRVRKWNGPHYSRNIPRFQCGSPAKKRQERKL